MKKIVYGHGSSLLHIAIIFCWIVACLACVAPLVAAVGDGTMKFILVANSKVTPVKIQTDRGSFLMDGINSPRVGLIFSQDH